MGEDGVQSEVSLKFQLLQEGRRVYRIHAKCEDYPRQHPVEHPKLSVIAEEPGAEHAAGHMGDPNHSHEIALLQGETGHDTLLERRHDDSEISDDSEERADQPGQAHVAGKSTSGGQRMHGLGERSGPEGFGGRNQTMHTMYTRHEPSTRAQVPQIIHDPASPMRLSPVVESPLQTLIGTPLPERVLSFSDQHAHDEFRMPGARSSALHAAWAGSSASMESATPHFGAPAGRDMSTSPSHYKARAPPGLLLQEEANGNTSSCAADPSGVASQGIVASATFQEAAYLAARPKAATKVHAAKLDAANGEEALPGLDGGLPRYDKKRAKQLSELVPLGRPTAAAEGVGVVGVVARDSTIHGASNAIGGNSSQMNGQDQVPWAALEGERGAQGYGAPRQGYGVHTVAEDELVRGMGGMGEQGRGEHMIAEGSQHAPLPMKGFTDRAVIAGTNLGSGAGNGSAMRSSDGTRR